MGRKETKWFNAERRKFVTQALVWGASISTIIYNVKNTFWAPGAPGTPTDARQFEGAARPSRVVNVEKIPGTGGLRIQDHEVIRVATASTTNTNALPVAGESTTNAVPVR